MRGSDDFADEKHVVARRVKRVMPAFEPCRAAFDQRRIRLAKAECHARETIGVRSDVVAEQYSDFLFCPGRLLRFHLEEVPTRETPEQLRLVMIGEPFS